MPGANGGCGLVRKAAMVHRRDWYSLVRRESPLLRYTSALPPRSRMPAPTITVLRSKPKRTPSVLTNAHDQQTNRSYNASVLLLLSGPGPQAHVASQAARSPTPQTPLPHAPGCVGCCAVYVTTMASLRPSARPLLCQDTSALSSSNLFGCHHVLGAPCPALTSGRSRWRGRACR